MGGEGLPELNKFVYETLQDAARLVALRLEDCRSQRHKLQRDENTDSLSGVSVRDHERLLAYNERIALTWR